MTHKTKITPAASPLFRNHPTRAQGPTWQNAHSLYTAWSKKRYHCFNFAITSANVHRF